MFVVAIRVGADCLEVVTLVVVLELPVAVDVVCVEDDEVVVACVEGIKATRDAPHVDSVLLPSHVHVVVAEHSIARAAVLAPDVEKVSRGADGVVEVAELDDEVEVALGRFFDEGFEPSLGAVCKPVVDIGVDRADFTQIARAN